MGAGFNDGPRAKLTPYQMLLVAGMLCTGCVNILVKKYTYETSSEGLHGVVHKFQKPWTMTWVMFWGEFLNLLFFLVRTKLAKPTNPPKSGYETKLLIEEGRPEPPKQEITLKSSLVCFLPAMCDIGGTTLSGIGLLYIQSSIYQLFRGTIIIFVGTFSFLVFKRKQYLYQWLGILICVGGVCIVGLASVHNTPPSGSATKSIIGGSLVALGMLSAAVQMVVEEKYLKGRNLPPDFVVGTEGVFGIIVMTCIVLPIVAFVPGHDGDGVKENAIDSVLMFVNSHKLQGLVLTYFVSIAFYNFCGLAVAKSLSAVHRTLIDACCTILVWSTDTILYYVTKHEYGEPWAGEWSGVEMAGFLCMLWGSVTYYAIIRYPRLEYPVTINAQPPEQADFKLLEERQ